MITPTCAMCRRELDEPGGILLGPPEANEMVRKLHLCVVCYSVVAGTIQGSRRRRRGQSG